MPKIVYLYTSGGASKCDLDILPDFDITARTSNRFAISAQSDGMINMFKQLAQTHRINRLIVLIDSKRSPGHIHLGYASDLYTVPSMSWANHFINPGDILVVRGGFKAWIPFLDYIYRKRENWILFYRANTNRNSWPFWDITLNDLMDEPRAIRGRLHYNFSKPVNEAIFGDIDAPSTLPREYDVMIGASHIHRKKGQYITVQALQKYYQLYGTKPRAIMPGGHMRCSTTRIIQEIIRSGDVDIMGPLSVSRQRLSLLMNSTKLFVHAGYGGQNDRGILEAMCCGCVTLLFGKTHVSPVIWRHSVPLSQDPANIATTIHQCLEGYESLYRTNRYKKINGLHEIAIPKMYKLLSFIDDHPTPDRSAACKQFVAS